MISERSCDTEENCTDNSALTLQEYILKYIKTEKSFLKLQKYVAILLFYSILIRYSFFRDI